MGSASSSPWNLAWSRRRRTHTPVSGFRALVRKTALLNLGIVLSALVAWALLARPEEYLILPLLVLMVSIVLWSATFAISGCVSLYRVFWGPGKWVPRQPPPRLNGGGSIGVGDPWLDEPA